MRPIAGAAQRTGKIVAYCSRSLTNDEQAHDTMINDCLTVVWAVLILSWYLKGSQFRIRRHNDTLRWRPSRTDETGKLERPLLHLEKFDYEADHRAGIEHHSMDALSRLPTTRMDESAIRYNVLVMPIA